LDQTRGGGGTRMCLAEEVSEVVGVEKVRILLYIFFFLSFFEISSVCVIVDNHDAFWGECGVRGNSGDGGGVWSGGDPRQRQSPV